MAAIRDGNSLKMFQQKLYIPGSKKRKQYGNYITLMVLVNKKLVFWTTMLMINPFSIKLFCIIGGCKLGQSIDPQP